MSTQPNNPYEPNTNPQAGQSHQQPYNPANDYQGQPGQPGYHDGFTDQPRLYTNDAFSGMPADIKSLALLVHIGTLAATYLSGTLLGFAVPLIFWFIYKKCPGYGYLRATAAGAFNFSFTMWIINMVATISIVLTLGIAAIFVWPVYLITGVLILVIHIIAAVKTNKGEFYTYPMQMKVLS